MFARALWTSGMENATFDDRLEEDFQWPEIGDTLFSQGTPVNAAFLERHPDYRSYHMTRGYKLAADLLVEQAEARGFSRRRQLVYPIVFCYRHFLELSLKDMLEKYGPMANVEPNRKGHQLESLWSNFRILLDNLRLDEGPKNKLMILLRNGSWSSPRLTLAHRLFATRLARTDSRSSLRQIRLYYSGFTT